MNVVICKKNDILEDKHVCITYINSLLSSFDKLKKNLWLNDKTPITAISSTDVSSKNINNFATQMLGFELYGTVVIFHTYMKNICYDNLVSDLFNKLRMSGSQKSLEDMYSLNSDCDTEGYSRTDEEMDGYDSY
jgi:hypothetical protein